MKILLSSKYIKSYRKLVTNNPPLHIKTKKQLKILLQNPKHPSLRLHKLSGEKIEQWSISVAKNIRIIFEYTDDGIYLTNIGTHNQVY